MVQDELDLVPTVATRCVAGKVYLAVSVENADDVAADITVSSPFGSKAFAAVKAGGAASIAFNSRLVSAEAGAVAITGTAGDATFERSVPYGATLCG